MIYLALIAVVLVGLYYQKQIRDGKIPRPTSPEGLSSRIIGIFLLIATLSLYLAMTLGDGLDRSDIVITLTSVAYAAWVFDKAKRRQGRTETKAEKRAHLKGSLIFLALTVLVSILLIIISLPR